MGQARNHEPDDEQNMLVPYGINKLDFPIIASVMFEARKQKMMEHFLEQFGNALSESFGPKVKEAVFDCPWCSKRHVFLVPLKIETYYVECPRETTIFGNPRKIKIEVTERRDIVISRG